MNDRRTSLPPILAALAALAFCMLVPAGAYSDQPAPAETPAGDSGTTANELSFEQTLAPFLATYCNDCHGVDEQNANRRFDQLSARIENDNTLVDYQDILDQLNLAAMPPDDAAQPELQEQRQVIAFLTQRITAFHAADRASARRLIMRRLNAREYRNTIRDLLKIDTTIFDPTIRFPRDQTSEHLDNIGETLVTSGHLLARYLEAADKVVRKAMGTLEKPEVQTWVFDDNFRQQPEIDQVHRKTNKFEHMTLYDVIGADKHEGAYGPILDFADGVPIDGYYEIQFEAEAVNRINPYDPEFLGMDPKQPFRLGIVPGDKDVAELHLPQPIEPLLAELELSDKPETYTVRVWLDQGYTPRFTFRNGLMDARNLWNRVIRKYPELFPKDIKNGIVAARYNAIAHGKLPQIHIDDIQIRGPLYDSWPTDSQLALFGDDWTGAEHEFTEKDVRRRLRNFAARAYRRPVADQEVDRVMQVVLQRHREGRSWVQAYADGAKAILCSPSFLFLDEVEVASPSHGLATRLSYFLWSSMPDPHLRRLADNLALDEPGATRRETLRMLDDPKSDALVNGFLGSWLGLRELGASPPDRRDFGDFYHYDLDGAMRRETFLFTRHVIDQNLPVRTFLDSDFTFVNPALARHYGIEPGDEPGFRRVALKDSRRGGLLTQASVLTLTANGIDTSPVVRGVWLLENVLGTPPTPPPPDVEPLDPDTRGAKTIRDQLEKHRSNPSCNDCHRNIDPLGFALENFDPIGGWRENYGRDKPIDASGELPGGRKFKDVVGLKQILLEQEDQFARALVTKLMEYAHGHHMDARDRPMVDEILEQTKPEGYRMRDIIVEVAKTLRI